MNAVSYFAREPFSQVLAVLIALVFLSLSLFHVYWALGGTFGSNAAIPQRPGSGGTSAEPAMVSAFTPSRSATLLVAAALLGVGALVVLRSGLFAAPVAHPAVRLAVAAVAIVMLARAVGDFRLVGFFKTVRGSTFARMDTRLYSPLCVLLGIGVALIA